MVACATIFFTFAANSYKMENDCKVYITEYGILPWLGKTIKCVDIYINHNLKEAGIDLTIKQMLVLKALSNLTKHGEKVYQSTLPIFKKLVLQVQENISEQDLEQTAKTLSKIKDNIENLNSGCNRN